MIIKNFQLNNLSINKSKLILLYGDNETFKNQIVEKHFTSHFKGLIQKYDEKQILDNYEFIFDDIQNKSFFENEKIIIVKRSTDKILKFVNDLISNKFFDAKIIFISSNLDKKSKLRAIFEKEKDLICIPFYNDDDKTLSTLARNFFKNNNISISQENINLIVDKANGDRGFLEIELQKIYLFLDGKKTLDNEDILKLVNLSQNFSVSKLVDNCLLKNFKTASKIINENSYSLEDAILIIRTLMSKSKRLLHLIESYDKSKDINLSINSHKPTIFWKDKNIVKNQIKIWDRKNILDIIYQINDIELLIKKNSDNSLKVLFNFLLNITRTVNN